ncbi:MAG: response regulator transcription factor [Cyclobacteriaceae bacterium]|nr:response regulator transcription factor [Cyclobacteriaceae bacterium]
MNKINVCVVDDHKIFRKAMIRLLKSFDRIGNVTDAENGIECLRIMKTTPADVVLLDLEMPVMDGADTAERLLTRFPETKIIVLTMHSNEHYMVHMIDMGVHSFLQKNTDPIELERAIVSVVERDFFHNEVLSAALKRHALEHKKGIRPSFGDKVVLTDREQEVLQLLCAEKTIKEISASLHISESTASVHKHNLMEKIGAKSMVGLVKYAYAKGILTNPL